MLGEVVAIDLDSSPSSRFEMLDQRSEITYDSLIVATGASQSYFGHPEFAHDAPGMKTIDDALELRGRILGAFEMAEREPDPVARRRFLTFVVVGAGPTGVELAGQLAELSRHTLRRNFRRIDPAEARIVLLDAAPTVLGAFPESLRQRAMRDLRDIGVEVHLGAAVTHVDAARSEYECDRCVAATDRGGDEDLGGGGPGLATRPAACRREPAPRLDRSGRVKVEDDCSLPGHPEVFVIGDLMNLRALPGVSQVAIQSGRHAADTIRRRLAGDTARRPFRYRDFGTMATISRFRALAAIGRRAPRRLSGLGALARRAPRGSHGFQAPPVRLLQLDRRLAGRRPRRARHHPAAGFRAARHGCTYGSPPYRGAGRLTRKQKTRTRLSSRPERTARRSLQ